MKARNDVRSLALMARVARVHEIRSKQALAAAIGQKDAQQAHTREAEAVADRSDAALDIALRGTAIDLARLPLLQELSAYVQAALTDERAALREREQDAIRQSGVAGKRARQRERLEEKTVAAIQRLRQAHETRQLEFATEAWMTLQNKETA